ncbi:MAG: UMP kinase [Clostridia bacterium]|nr:UMP kinase [Clostridia bacterium]MBR5752938.1 UMP kinase [Clostridia bacterium]
MTPKFGRILLKLSGEVLAGEQGHGFDFDVIESICDAIAKVVDMGVSVGVVIGGGNFWRGRSSGSMDRCRADSIGMLGTVMNSIAVADTLIAKGVPAKVYSAIGMEPAAELFSADKARADLKDGVVTIFGGGTGNPFFSTDSAAALRAAQIEADVIFKATNVDGVYDKDPNKFADAVKFDELTQSDLLSRGLEVMDASAASLCRDNGIDILVFNLTDPENIVRAVSGETVGTLCRSK